MVALDPCAVSNMNVWIVALYELEETKQVMRRLGIWKPMRHPEFGCFGMQRTDAASKKQMLAYLLASLAKCMVMTPGSKEHYLGKRCFGI